MTQDVLIKMSSDIGQLCGTVTSIKEYQENHINDIKEILKENDSRITSLENARAKLSGIALGTGVIGGGIITGIIALAKAFVL